MHPHAVIWNYFIMYIADVYAPYFFLSNNTNLTKLNITAYSLFGWIGLDWIGHFKLSILGPKKFSI